MASKGPGNEEKMNLTKYPRRTLYDRTDTHCEAFHGFPKPVGGPEVYIKRDDLLGLTGGGNKTRKLEFLVAEALSQGGGYADHMRSGTVQSLPVDSGGRGYRGPEMPADTQ